jgi:hypothetical protein
MPTNISQNGDLMLIINLLLGGYAIFEAIKSYELMVEILGLNVGYGAQGCGIQSRKTKKKKTQLMKIWNMKKFILSNIEKPKEGFLEALLLNFYLRPLTMGRRRD